MRARTVIAGVAVVLLLASSLAARADDRHLVTALGLTPVSAAPPPLSLPRLEDGRSVRLADLRGRPVLLYFFATW
jgi:cytochrome oxidase Cu insertion factor (SCO1/SenC/PrrC family)